MKEEMESISQLMYVFDINVFAFFSYRVQALERGRASWGDRELQWVEWIYCCDG